VVGSFWERHRDRMRSALDARKLTQTDSSIGNYTLNLARALLEEDKALELVLVCHTPHKQTRLYDPRITEVLFPFLAISPFTQFALGPFLRRQHCDVFHAPFDVAP
jgi:hypothetical protein